MSQSILISNHSNQKMFERDLMMQKKIVEELTDREIKKESENLRAFQAFWWILGEQQRQEEPEQRPEESERPAIARTPS